ncbi:hypothetical protein AVEN_234201-1 [Araneus ventricosus]|uniref:Transposase domain-containing protein n=1 Tax=Araneus ventricosus TaxID=182803 RepID=A0A4Y2CNK2_ARAVE|nr:hypothetical protein AVEN_234201-1 [Araneus ventricosus]
MADGIYKKRGTYNRFLRTDEPIPKSTFYSKRKLSESQHADDTDDNTSMSAFCDAEEKFSCETSPHIDEDIHFNDLEFDCFNVDSTDCEDNDTYQNDDVKVNLANLNEPLYPSSSVSLLDAYISILAFSLRHNITKTCMQDLLQLFNVLLPPSNLPGTKHLFYSKLSSLFDNSTQAYIYCKYCFETVCLLSDKHKSDICKECLKSFDFQDSMKQGYFFMYMPLEPQLKLKFQYQNLMHNIKKYKRIFEEPSSSYRDILDGEAYAKIKNLKYSDNISLQFNIDGIPMYRKSNYQIWPIQCMINELPPNERKDHILMCGLWFGPHKPNMNVFLKPFVTELSNLSRSGFKWIDATNSKQIVTKVFPIICSSDAPARAAVQNFIQYNGKYGCGFCQHSRERVEKGKGFCRIYPLQQPLPEIRSFEQCVNFAEEASLTGKAVHGVKGPTELMKLYPNFDLVQSFVPDYMHAVLLGVVRQIMSLWIQTSSNDFSINQKSLRVLNHRILNIKFPQETTRKLRSTNEVLFWKASEFRIFLFVSPIILKNLISKNVYNHWLLLVHGISLLLGNEVTTNDLEEAEFALQKFVYGVKDIYGIQEQTYNIHLLLHLPQAVKSWGPLWAHSCFIYEGALGQLKQFHHGTRGEASQILSSYAMQSILKLLILQENVKNSRVQAYIQNMQQKRHSTIRNPKINNCVLLGLQKSIKLPRVHEVELLKLLPMNNLKGLSSVVSYERMLYCNKLFSTKRYSQKFVRADFMLRIGQNICFVLNYIIVYNEEVFLIGEKLSTKKLKKSDNDIGFICRNILLCENLESDNVLAIRPIDIINKYMIVPFQDRDEEINYLIPLNNAAEQ